MLSKRADDVLRNHGSEGGRRVLGGRENAAEGTGRRRRREGRARAGDGFAAAPARPERSAGSTQPRSEPRWGFLKKQDIYPKMRMELQGTRTDKIILRKNRAGLMLPKFKTYYLQNNEVGPLPYITCKNGFKMDQRPIELNL